MVWTMNTDVEQRDDTMIRRGGVPRGLWVYLSMLGIVGFGGGVLGAIALSKGAGQFGVLFSEFVAVPVSMECLLFMRARRDGLLPKDLSYRAVKARGYLVKAKNTGAWLLTLGEAVFIPVAAFLAARLGPGNRVFDGLVAAVLALAIVLAVEMAPRRRRTSRAT